MATINTEKGDTEVRYKPRRKREGQSTLTKATLVALVVTLVLGAYFLIKGAGAVAQDAEPSPASAAQSPADVLAADAWSSYRKAFTDGSWSDFTETYLGLVPTSALEDETEAASIESVEFPGYSHLFGDPVNGCEGGE